MMMIVGELLILDDEDVGLRSVQRTKTTSRSKIWSEVR